MYNMDHHHHSRTVTAKSGAPFCTQNHTQKNKITRSRYTPDQFPETNSLTHHTRKSTPKNVLRPPPNMHRLQLAHPNNVPPLQPR